MRILLTNYALDKFAGSEMWNLTMYNYLKKDHDVVIYTKYGGEISNYFDDVITEKDKLGEYDLIIGSQYGTMGDVWGRGKTIQVSHSFFVTIEKFMPDVADAYVAVTEEVAEVERARGFDPIVIPNPINLKTYYPRNKPRKKLTKVFYMSHDGGLAGGVIKEACDEYGIEYMSIEKPMADLSGYMNEADLCIGIGRCLIEAMACGRNVISGDWRRWMVSFDGAGFLTPANLDSFRYDNYSNRREQGQITKQDLLNYFDQYDYQLGDGFVQAVQAHHSVDKIVDQFMEVYRQISR